MRLNGSRRHLCPKPPETFERKLSLFWLKEQGGIWADVLIQGGDISAK